MIKYLTKDSKGLGRNWSLVQGFKVLGFPGFSLCWAGSVTLCPSGACHQCAWECVGRSCSLRGLAAGMREAERGEGLILRKLPQRLLPALLPWLRPPPTTAPPAGGQVLSRMCPGEPHPTQTATTLQLACVFLRCGGRRY